MLKYISIVYFFVVYINLYYIHVFVLVLVVESNKYIFHRVKKKSEEKSTLTNTKSTLKHTHTHTYISHTSQFRKHIKFKIANVRLCHVLLLKSSSFCRRRKKHKNKNKQKSNSFIRCHYYLQVELWKSRPEHVGSPTLWRALVRCVARPPW